MSNTDNLKLTMELNTGKGLPSTQVCYSHATVQVSGALRGRSG
jgi:hypothetical protein